MFGAWNLIGIAVIYTFAVEVSLTLPSLALPSAITYMRPSPVSVPHSNDLFSIFVSPFPSFLPAVPLPTRPHSPHCTSQANLQTKQLSLEEMSEVFDAPRPKLRSFELAAVARERVKKEKELLRARE